MTSCIDCIKMRPYFTNVCNDCGDYFCDAHAHLHQILLRCRKCKQQYCESDIVDNQCVSCHFHLATKSAILHCQRAKKLNLFCVKL